MAYQYDGFDLTGKVAVITGGNGGIGLGYARGVAAAGADVSIWGTNPDKNAAAEAELRGINPSASALCCDVSDEEQVEEAMAAVVERYGRVDACFPNAGIGTQNQKGFHEHSNEDWFSVIDVNLHGVFFTLRAATRQMIAQGEGGSLVLTSSGTAIQGAARGQAYAATKGAMLAMMMGLSVEMARYKINANAVIPGWIDTAMTERLFTWDKFVDNVMPRIPMRRWGVPDDFGAIAVYLMSNAARWHTGDVIKIDGGFSIF
ncbi:SDR family NAD(P)-dependent oxidoreductase [Candidatus Poriferisodalis sp.]|uniref:SDR family NAD(P)-dependent oxidoreductase n=1 Tax=Candidatus Poriferisodalis sp. TaxID=3101277 RepID=UPI003B025DF6